MMSGVEGRRRAKEGEAAGLNTSSIEEKAAGNPLWQGLILAALQIVRFWGIRFWLLKIEVGEN